MSRLTTIALQAGGEFGFNCPDRRDDSNANPARLHDFLQVPMISIQRAGGSELLDVWAKKAISKTLRTKTGGPRSVYTTDLSEVTVGKKVDMETIN
jgi:hypothetical protein